MNQTKIESLLETFLNIGSGFVLSLFLWVFIVAPIWNIQVAMSDNFMITCLFTVVSIIRSYFWRRFFNAGIHKAVHKFVKVIFNG